MHNLRKIMVILLFLLVSLAGCELGLEHLAFTYYPKMVTADEPFDIKAEYLTRNPEEKKLKLILDIREIATGKSVKTLEKEIRNESRVIVFQHILLPVINSDLYFELKLIEAGKIIEIVDTSSDPAYRANWHENIKTTYFLAEDEDGNPLQGSWGNDLTQENPYYFALPYRDFYQKVDGEWRREEFYGEKDVKNRWIEIRYQEGNEAISVFAQWVDVGPWNYYDPYYVFEYQRPYAEMGIDMGWSSQGFRATNGAGLDVSPEVMKYLGQKAGQDFIREGVVEFNWRFVEEERVPKGPWLENVSTEEGDRKIFNLETKTLRTLD